MRLRSLVSFIVALTALALLLAGSAAAEMPQTNTPASISGNAEVGQQVTAQNGT
jgi:outer membrane biogenesis lipoprotein LolB